MPRAGILIVEDSFIVAYHLQATLEQHGYAVLGQVDSGEQAIDFIRQQRPDVVLMDIMLNGVMDGIETATYIRNQFDLPVIYITALTDKDTIQRAKITEPYGYLTKPFEDMQVFTVIEMALYKHDIRARLKESEEKYHTTVNSISDCVVSVDLNHAISFLNESAESLTQWSLRDAMGRPVSEVLRLREEGHETEWVNPLQCTCDIPGVSSMPGKTVLVGRLGLEVPVGESSISALHDRKGNFSGLTIVFKNLTYKREHEKLSREIRKLELTSLIEGQEKERSRIAKELQGGLCQALEAMRVNLARLVRGNAEAASLERLLEHALKESGRISENLLPATLSDFDLATCLYSLCMQSKQHTRAEIAFEDTSGEVRLTKFQKINLYRIAQDLIAAATEHGRPSHIHMQLSRSNGSIFLTVHDNGQTAHGAAAMTEPAGITMHDRVESMGGALYREASPGSGTLIRVEVPLAAMPA